MSSDGTYPATLDGLVEMVERLRAPDGCPWDREQTPDSTRGMLLEECYELVDAIDGGDTDRVVEELGDLLFHVVFQLQMGREAGRFTSQQVIRALLDKLVRRHPHVFGDAEASDARTVEANWEDIKRSERRDSEASVLDGVPTQMPALSYAQAVQHRAAGARFDWDDMGGVLDKVGEELEELARADSASQREHEFGDLLFSMVNAARWLKIDAELSLRRANARFYARFAAMERLARRRGLSFPDLVLDQKEALWREAKGLEG